MPSLAMTLPYMRVSPIHIPRRDLVLSAADSLFLRVTVVDSDDPRARTLELTSGLGGPAAKFIVWDDTFGQMRNDYGAMLPTYRHVLWDGAGVPIAGTGAFDFSFSSSTMAAWPLRCGWAVRLWWDDVKAETLAEGTLNVRPAYGGGTPVDNAAITTDTPPLDPITTD